MRRGCSPSGRTIVQVRTPAWRKAPERAGIADFRWHDLRHTFATWHRQAGTPARELQRLGGWKTGATVERYAHVASEALHGAANRLDAFGGYETAGHKGKRPRRCRLSRCFFTGGP
jgi:integrase